MHNSFIKYIYFIAAILLFSGCKSVKSNFLRKNDQPYIQISDGESLAKYNLESYTVQPRDLLTINLNSPDINTNLYFNKEGGGMRVNQPNATSLYLSGYLVTDSGYVNLPMIGHHEVVGKTVEEIEIRISEELKKYLKEFSVSVKLANFRVSVLGEVVRPGTFYFYESKVTILQALSTAGDFQEYADRSQVRVVREMPDKTETFLLNLKGADFLSSQQFLLRTGDVIYIEPLKSKVFNTNSRVISLVLSTITAAFTLYRIIQTQ
jgi:polysaccharide biosynthesis/export protein